MTPCEGPDSSGVRARWVLFFSAPGLLQPEKVLKRKKDRKKKKPTCSSPKQPALMAASCDGRLASGGVCSDAGVSVPFTDPKFLSEGLWC